MASVEKFQWKRVSVNFFSIGNIWDGTIDETIGRLQTMKSELEESGFRNIEMDIEYDHEYTELLMYAERLETEKEVAQRIKKDEKKREIKAAKKAKKEAKERAEFERLRKKYEKEGV